MTQVSIVRDNAILSFTAAIDLTGHEGRAIVATAQNEVTLMIEPEHEIPLGVLVKGGKAGEQVSVALAHGGLAGTVRIKLAKPVTQIGTVLSLNISDDPTDPHFGFAPAELCGTCLRWALALETGVAGERIEGILFPPLKAAATLPNVV